MLRKQLVKLPPRYALDRHGYLPQTEGQFTPYCSLLHYNISVIALLQ
jgi:hypothetical protein